MEKTTKRKKPRKVELGNAFLISFICIFTYLISYYLRHVLSYFTPQMLNDGFEKTSIALLSSTYMIVYAAGQLLNGFLGDIIRPKYMVATGLGFATVGTLLFPLADVYGLRLVCFGLLGFGLSMLRGPLVKTISENTEPGQARVACVFLSAVSLSGRSSPARLPSGWIGAPRFSSPPPSRQVWAFSVLPCSPSWNAKA